MEANGDSARAERAPLQDQAPRLPEPFDMIDVSARVVRGVARSIYTYNPLYAASACFVLFGLHRMLRPDGNPYYSWYLLAALGAYALLLAATAVAVVRLGKVWDDARTLLLTVVLLLVVMSGSFDRFVLRTPGTGRLVMLVSFVFAAALSEGLLRALGVRLSLLFRVPYHIPTIICSLSEGAFPLARDQTL